MVRGAKAIAEFKIRKHLEKLEERGLVMDNISFEMKSQNEAELTDVNGDKLRLIYDQETRTVIEI